MPISAVDAIQPAFNHAKQQLFQPFRAWQWAKLALVGMLAGEMGSGGCNLNGPHSHSGGGLHGIHPIIYAWMIAFIVVVGIVLAFLLLYVSSVMRFVLFDAIVAKECRIRASWSHRQRPGLRYFGWHLLFILGTGTFAALTAGVVIALAFGLGLTTHPKAHLVPLILGGICLFFLFLAFIFVAAVILVFTKDFVVPQMALENISAFEGWRRLWAGIKAEKGAYAAYIGMKILMAIGAAIVLGIISVIVLILLALPLGGAGFIAVLAGKAAGLTWNAYTITLAVVVGSFFLAIILYVMALISVPAMVFFPAYAIYFFASRYRPLDAVLHPAPTAPPAIPPPDPEPPPLPPDLNPLPT